MNKSSVLLFTVATLLYTAPTESQELSVRKAVVISFKTTRGVIYRLQTSTDLVNWNPLLPLVIGNDKPHRLFLSTESATSHHYRLETAGKRPEFQGFSYIPSSSFLMGDHTGKVGGKYGEIPQHRVSFREFYMQQSEVTNSQMVEALNWGLAKKLIAANSDMAVIPGGPGRSVLQFRYGGHSRWPWTKCAPTSTFGWSSVKNPVSR